MSNNVCILRSRQEKNIFISNALLMYGVYNYALTLSENGGGGCGGVDSCQLTLTAVVWTGHWPPNHAQFCVVLYCNMLACKVIDF